MLFKDLYITKSDKSPLYYAKNFLLFAASVVVLDMIIGSLLQYYYFKINHESNYRTTYVLEKTTADILIFGSSRANYHYVAPLIGEKLHESCYNAGMAGNFIFYHYALLQGVLKRYTPKAVIFDVIPEDFDKDPLCYDRISTLLPYYRSHPEIREIIELKSRFEKIKLLSRIYPYNSNLIRIITGNVDLHDKKAYEMINMGYVHTDLVWKEPIKEKSFNNEVDTIKLKYFKAFMTECQDAHIKIYLFISPFYSKIKGEAKYMQIVREFARERNIPLWDYSQDKDYILDPHLFADPGHLSAVGAKKYTLEIIRDIQTYESKKLSTSVFLPVPASH